MDFDFEEIQARYGRISNMEDPSAQSHAAAIAYSLDVPHLLNEIKALVEDVPYLLERVAALEKVARAARSIVRTQCACSSHEKPLVVVLAALDALEQP